MQKMQERHEEQVVEPAPRNGVPVTTSLLTAEDVSRLLHVDASTVYRMASHGRLPAVKVGRQWRFPADPIARLLQVSQSAPATSAPSVGPAWLESATDRGHAQAVVEIVADLLGVMMVVTDMRGRPLTPIANPCPWFVRHGSQTSVLQSCLAEWQGLADDPDFEPRFRVGKVGFECARAIVRDGSWLVGMVLAGGVAPAGESANDRYSLDEAHRGRVLRTLPKLAAALSRSPLPKPAFAGTELSEGVVR